MSLTIVVVINFRKISLIFVNSSLVSSKGTTSYPYLDRASLAMLIPLLTDIVVGRWGHESKKSQLYLSSTDNSNIFLHQMVKAEP